jgi:hypothetical protein
LIQTRSRSIFAGDVDESIGFAMLNCPRQEPAEAFPAPAFSHSRCLAAW